MQGLDLEHTALLDKVELLSLCPCVFECVRKHLAILEMLSVLREFVLSRCLHLVWIFAVVQEKVIMRVLITDSFFEQLPDLLKIGQCVHI